MQTQADRPEDDATPARARRGARLRVLAAGGAVLVLLGVGWGAWALRGSSPAPVVSVPQSPTRSPERSAAPSAACTVAYSVADQWAGGFRAEVVVTNNGSARTAWQVSWTFPGGQSVDNLWDGTVAVDGATVSVANADWNGALAAEGQVTFGFTGTWTGTNDAPDDFRLDGQPCTGPDGTPNDAASAPAPTSAAAGEAPVTGGLYTDSTTQAAAAWQLATGADKELLARIALTPQATWVGDWTDAASTAARVHDVTSAALAAGQTTTLVVYAIPGRDCGLHSAGGVATSEYARWVDQVAGGVVGSPVVVLEPDALAQLGDCDGQGDRVGYLRYAAHALTAAGGRVYLDVGHSGWLSPETAAERLQQVGFDDAVGFALNTSNYQTTADSRAYGEQVSALVGGKGFVVDTSRNGNGSNGEWCNPRGRALGEAPVLVDDGTHLDALLWVKAPGESDGTCNGGPAAGAWWQDVALELARNAQG